MTNNESKCDVVCFFIDSWLEKYDFLLKNVTCRNQMPPVKRSKNSNISKLTSSDERLGSKSDSRAFGDRNLKLLDSKMPQNRISGCQNRYQKSIRILGRRKEGPRSVTNRLQRPQKSSEGNWSTVGVRVARGWRSYFWDRGFLGGATTRAKIA